MKRIKYLGINLPKGIKGHKTIKHWLYYMKKIEDDTNRWKNTPRSWIGIINIVKMSIIPKAIIDSMQNLSN